MRFDCATRGVQSHGMSRRLQVLLEEAELPEMPLGA
jgi:hypothetical protein